MIFCFRLLTQHRGSDAPTVSNSYTAIVKQVDLVCYRCLAVLLKQVCQGGLRAQVYTSTRNMWLLVTDVITIDITNQVK